MIEVKGGKIGDVGPTGVGTCTCRCEGPPWAELEGKIAGSNTAGACGCACTSGLESTFASAQFWHL